MVTINTTDDLLRALREQPEFLQAARSLILSDELLDLPKRFELQEERLAQQEERQARLEERMNQLAEQMAELSRVVTETNRRLDEFIAATNRNFELFNQRLERLESDMTEVKSDVSTLKSDMTEVKSDVSTLKSDMTEVKSDVSTLKSDMTEVKSDVSTLKSDMVQVKAKLDQQDGAILEQKVHNSILNIAKDHLDLTHGRVLKSSVISMTQRLRDDVDNAEEQGLITYDAAAELHVVDLIIRGRRRSDRTYVHAAIEVSRTINDDDITRARDRARTLSTVVGEEAMAVVVGETVNPPQQALADREGVRVVTPALFR